MRAALTALACVAALLGFAPSAHAQDPTTTCADFASQADAQAYFLANGGGGNGTPGTGVPNLDADRNGIACDQGELPCPCDYTLTAVPPEPPVTSPAPRTQSKVLLHVSVHHATQRQRVWFTITRLSSTGGTFTKASGLVMLQERTRGHWHTVPGSRCYTTTGSARMWYYVLPGRLAVRARTIGPAAYSKSVRLNGQAAG
jgi:hypothetical protein